MRRRHKNQNDSLDMLLDTMANVFGSIMFIAIIVAILSSSGSVARHIAKDFATDLSHHSIEQLRRQVLEIEEAANFSESSFADNSESKELMRILVHLNEMYNHAQSRRDRAELLWAQFVASESQYVSQQTQTESELNATEQEIQRIDQEIIKMREARTVRARLPVERATNKSPKHVVLRYGRFFEVYTGNGQDYSRPVATDVKLRRSGRQTHVSMVAGGGVRVTDDFGKVPRWVSLRRSIDPARHFLYIVVFPDSYAEFSILKQAALAAGLEYHVLAIDPDGELILVPGVDFRTQ